MPLQESESAGGGSPGGEIWQDIEEELREQAARLSSNLALSHQENRELQERLMVSEATVHAQAEQLKDYRELLSERREAGPSIKDEELSVLLLSVQLRHRSSRPANRCRWTSRIWVMRLAAAVRMKQREKTPAAQVTPSHRTMELHRCWLWRSIRLSAPSPSSADFDDLEMCTSLSLQQDDEADGGGWYAGHSGGESAHLHHLVEDLRSQLTRCHKVIRGLQMRVRSLSATSDYASSLERTPRKVLPQQTTLIGSAVF